ncbi:MAG TPA: ABC transporter ATP-binding protein [Acidobacteriota bacterium]|nr:ABC transporter ATP-binding protein [Acidobacteriota bacterium]
MANENNDGLMIKLEGIHKFFGGKDVLKGLDLEVREGESVVVIGGSGSGKSVMLKHIIGLIKPDKGRVLINGIDITNLPERKINEVRRNIGMLFQEGALFDSMSVCENVSFSLAEHTNMKRKEISERVAHWLGEVGLAGIEDLRPSELSGGMRKRVALARALAYEPKIVLYDEPTTGLDPIMADVINSLIKELNEKLAVTSVTITHDLTSAVKIADRIAMLYDGKIIDSGTPEEIMNSDNAFVHQFVSGSSEGPIKIAD